VQQLEPTEYEVRVDVDATGLPLEDCFGFVQAVTSCHNCALIRLHVTEGNAGISEDEPPVRSGTWVQ